MRDPAAEELINPLITPRFDLDTPLEPVVYSRIFLEVLGEEGIEPQRALAGTGLSPAALADPSSAITVRQQVQLYANAARLSRDPAIGLANGRRILPYHHGVWGYAMQTSTDLGHAIRIFNQYFDVVGPIARQVLRIDGNLARWQSVDILPLEPARRVGIDEMLGGNYTLCSNLTEGRFRLKELWLDFPATPSAAAYEEFFRCPVRFGQPSIEMRFDASQLNYKLRYADPESHRVCELRCEELLRSLKQSGDTVARVRRIIYESPCDRRDVDSVATVLCVSARTLRRKLNLCGSSFRDVLTEVQRALAVEYLSKTNLSVDEIAFLLGYSETSNFRHAFKQWTGKTPTAFRLASHHPS